MNKIIKNNLISAVKVLSLFALVVIVLMPRSTHAGYTVRWENGKYIGYPTSNVNTVSTVKAISPTASPLYASITKSITPTAKVENNSLSANALFGSDGFMPTNVFQWFLLFIMILLMIILTRKIVSNKDKQLKHA